MLSSLSNNQRGIVAICGCMASYTVNDVLVKQILRTYPVGEVDLRARRHELAADRRRSRWRSGTRSSCAPP